MDKTYAFRIVGSPDGGKRRLVGADAVFSAYLDCDPRCKLHTESYLSAFYYNQEFADYLNYHGTPRGYDGACWSPWLWFDIDREGDLSQAHADAKTLCRHAGEDYQIEPADMLIFFSGSKGFHCALPLNWSPIASPQSHTTSRQVAEDIAGRVGVVIDPDIYKKIQPFRSPNTRHPKTGLFKRWLTSEQLGSLSIDEIVSLAKQPAPYHYEPTGKLSIPFRSLWEEIERRLTARPPDKIQKNPEVEGTDGARLNRATLDFIRNGAGQGERARRLYSASRNLAEFDCPTTLAHALLTEAGLDSGLPPNEIRRQIDCGLRGGQ